jgi:hypothetical protein
VLLTRMRLIAVAAAVFWSASAAALLNAQGLPMTEAEEEAIRESFEAKWLENDLHSPRSLLASLHFNYHQGGDISGGGTVASWKGDARFLLDFAVIDPHYHDSREILTNEETLFTENLTPENIVNGVRIDLKTAAPKSFALLQERLNLWESNSPAVTAAIRKIVHTTTWRATMLGIIQPNEFELPPGLDRQKMSMSAVSLVMKGYGVFIDNRLWTRPLGLTSRAGLFAHEALRTVKVEISERLSNKILQEITAHLMLTDPATKPAGFLDQMFLTELWSDAAAVGNSSEPVSDYYMKVVCDRGAAIAEAAHILENATPEFDGWTPEVAYNYLRQLDSRTRKEAAGPVREVFRQIPKLEDSKSLEDVPPRTLSFWLDHFRAVDRFEQQKTFPLDIIPGTPADLFKKNAALFARPYWSAVRHRLENLQPAACAPGAAVADQRNFLRLMNTSLGELSNSLVKVDRVTFYQNFRNTGFLSQPETSKYIDDVMLEAMGANTCHSKSWGGKIIFLGPPSADAEDCQPVPKKYFPNGGPPELPRIGSK